MWTGKNIPEGVVRNWVRDLRNTARNVTGVFQTFPYFLQAGWWISGKPVILQGMKEQMRYVCLGNLPCRNKGIILKGQLSSFSYQTIETIVQRNWKFPGSLILGKGKGWKPGATQRRNLSPGKRVLVVRRIRYTTLQDRLKWKEWWWKGPHLAWDDSVKYIPRSLLKPKPHIRTLK